MLCNRRYLLLLWLLSAATIGFSQNSLRLNVITVSDSAPALGDEVLVFANLQNTDTSNTFTGIVNFEVANSFQNLSNSNIMGSPPYSGTQITLEPQEEIPALFTVKVDEQYFKAGPDIIVIWPMAVMPPKDSVRIPFFIHLPAGIEGFATLKPTLITNGNQLTVMSGFQGKNTLKQVRIFDLTGQLVLTQSSEEKNIHIDIATLPRGLFICELSYDNNKPNVFKFVKF